MESLTEFYRIGRGPSSSHTIGPYRIIKEYLKLYPQTKNFKVHLYGSLALTGRGHKTDVALQEAAGEDRKIHIIWDIKKVVDHPNTMDVIGIDAEGKELPLMTGISVGGGAIEIVGTKHNHNLDVYPQKSFNEIREYCKCNKFSLVDYVKQFDPEGFKHLKEVYRVMCNSIAEGFKRRGLFNGPIKLSRKALDSLERIKQHNLPKDSIYYAMSYAYAVAEVNVEHGVVVTAPTLGSAGILPAVMYYCEHNLGLSEEKIIEGLAVAGVIGNCFKHNGVVAGASGGCQAEQGSACSMAAGAYAYLIGANIDEIETAAIIALEHHLGLTCDPILGHVYSPCIERNAQLAMRAILAGQHAILIAGTHEIFDLDDIIEVQVETGRDLKPSYCETGLGGLSKKWKQKYNWTGEQ